MRVACSKACGAFEERPQKRAEEVPEAVFFCKKMSQRSFEKLQSHAQEPNRANLCHSFGVLVKIARGEILEQLRVVLVV